MKDFIQEHSLICKGYTLLFQNFSHIFNKRPLHHTLNLWFVLQRDEQKGISMFHNWWVVEGTGCSTNSTLNVHQMIFKRIHVFLFKFMLMICVFNYLKSFESSSSKNNLYIVWSIHQKHENFRDGWAECQGHHTTEARQNK